MACTINFEKLEQKVGNLSVNKCDIPIADVLFDKFCVKFGVWILQKASEAYTLDEIHYNKWTQPKRGTRSKTQVFICGTEIVVFSQMRPVTSTSMATFSSAYSSQTFPTHGKRTSLAVPSLKTTF
ncbi:hypothetical protein B7494_g2776 [Chlorociboria aeruginascens]|nr:hypothetical protein B7494_g2776 [Chlorociboria aeruginascens]